MKAQGACPGRLTAVRVVVFVLLFLAGGAVVNVGVAWGRAVFTPIQLFIGYIGPVRAVDQVQWEVEEIRGWGFMMIRSQAGRSMRDNGRADARPLWSRVSVPATEADLLNHMIDERAFGWPMLCLFHCIDLSWPYDRTAHGMGLGWSPFRSQEQSIVRLRPLWPGFAINTIFYAAILWLLFAFAFTLRRWRRIRGGRCGACGYPVGASPVCTECGQAVKVGEARAA